MKYIEFFALGFGVILLVSVAEPLVTVLNVGLAYMLGGLTMFLSQIRNQQSRSTTKDGK